MIHRSLPDATGIIGVDLRESYYYYYWFLSITLVRFQISDEKSAARLPPPAGQ